MHAREISGRTSGVNPGATSCVHVWNYCLRSISDKITQSCKCFTNRKLQDSQTQGTESSRAIGLL